MTFTELPPGRVIMTYGRALITLAAAHSLGRKGVEIIGADNIELNLLSFSRYVADTFIYADPTRNEDQFIQDLEENIERFRPQDDRPYLLMPIHKHTKIISQYKQRLSERIQVICPDWETFQKVHPKQNFIQTSKEQNVCIPHSMLPESEAMFERAISDEPFDFPVLIKPYEESGGRGIEKVPNREQLKERGRASYKTYGTWPIIQEVVEGEDFCVCALFKEGEIKTSMAYQNLQIYPRESGAGILRETVPVEPFFTEVKKLMKPLEWTGVAEIDFRWNEDLETPPKMIEVNPRFWGGLFQSVESGVNFPALLYECSVNGDIAHSPEPEIGTRTKLPAVWILNALQEVADSQDRTKEIDRAWQEAKAKLGEGEVFKGLKMTLDTLGMTFDKREEIETFLNHVRQNRQAQSELFASDDPFVGLGLLHILVSLLKYGELPPELKH